MSTRLSKMDRLKRYDANVRESIGERSKPRPKREEPVPDLLDETRAKHAMEVPIAKIMPDPDQPRKSFDEDALARLAESLRTRGQLQPIRVRWHGKSRKYLIICGERRWRAAGIAGLKTLTAIVHDRDPDADELLEIQLIENCLREDLKPTEQARAFRALMERRGWNAKQLAEALRVSEATVSRSLSLLALHKHVQRWVDLERMHESTARYLARLRPKTEQVEMGKQIIREKVPGYRVVRMVRDRLAELKTAKAQPAENGTPKELGLLHSARASAQVQEEQGPATKSEARGAPKRSEWQRSAPATLGYQPDRPGEDPVAVAVLEEGRKLEAEIRAATRPSGTTGELPFERLDGNYTVTSHVDMYDPEHGYRYHWIKVDDTRETWQLAVQVDGKPRLSLVDVLRFVASKLEERSQGLASRAGND